MAAKQPYSASIRPRPRTDGSVAYDVRFRQDGKQRTFSFDQQNGAEKWANILRAIGPAEAAKFLKVSDAKGTPTVAEYAESYINIKSGIESGTKEKYRMYMRLHIGPTLGPLPLDAVSSAAIANWINMRVSEGAAAKTIKNEHGFLSAMFQSAVDADPPLISRDPCTSSRLPESEQREMVFLLPDEFTEFLAYIPDKWQPLVLLLANTGCRWGEATALRPGDFDLDAKSVRISRAWKRSKAQGWYVGPPKTRRSKRPVTIPANLIAVLRPLIAEAIRDGRQYVFVNAYHHPIRQQNFHEAVWTPARRLANGLPAFEAAKGKPDQAWRARKNGVWDDRKPATKPLGKWPRIHDLRHSHASWLLGAGVGIDVVSRRLGHETIQTTMDVYGHIAMERRALAGEAIGVVLAGAMPEIEPQQLRSPRRARAQRTVGPAV